MNQVVLVGRLTRDPELIELNKCTRIELAITRSYKNTNGEYDTDFIPCYLYDTLSITTQEYCKKGDTVGIKGVIQSDENGIKLVAEKVTYLAQRRSE